MKIKHLFEAITPKIPKRKLGKTGYNTTILGLGGQGSLETQGGKSNCIDIIQTAYELGINYFDTAPVYGPSEDYYGEATKGFRDKIFLASKTDDRTYDGSMRLLERSLRRLKTDYLDLWQIHHLETIEEVDQCTKVGGALEAMLEMREQGVIKHIGITGHEHPRPLLEIMKRAEFDTVLCPVNAADIHVNPSFIKTLIPKANKDGMGIIGMKVLAQGHIFNRRGLTTPWAPLCYAMSQPVSTIIVGHDSVEQLKENVAIAQSFVQLKEQELKDIEKQTKSYYRKASFFRSEFGGYDSINKLPQPIQIIPTNHG